MDAEQQFQAAAQMYQSGDFPGAEAGLTALALVLPNNPNVLHLLSLTQLRQDKADAAADNLKKLTDLAPGSAEAHDLLGCALRQSGRVNAAIRHFRKALDIAPDAANIHYNLGNAYRDDRQIPLAAKHYKQAADLEPDNLNALFNLGQCHYNLENFDQAAAILQRVVDRAPNDLEARVLLARTYYLSKRHALTRKTLEGALTLSQDDPEILGFYAEVTAMMGDFRTAVEYYDLLLAKRPGDSVVLRAKAAALRAMGDVEGALDHFRKAVQAAPNDPANRVALGTLLERMNRPDDAWAEITPALDQHPGDPALNLVAARLEQRAGDHGKALARLNGLDPAMRDASPALGDIRFEMGMLYERLNRPGDAVENFELGNAFLARDVQAVAMFRTRSAEYLERLKRAYDGPAAQPAGNSVPGDDGTPVFLVGFPRSGEALLEQMMDAHPGIQVLKEQAALSVVRDHLLARGDDFPANLFDISDADMTALREIYFQAVDRAVTRGPDTVLVDTLPLNILDAGLIHRLFPDAKFILAQRHPCDICLDCFTHPFAMNDGTVHFTRLDDAVGFYEQVMALWQTQRETLALKVHEVRHEDLISGHEQTARKLLEFLDVSWNAGVLAPLAAEDEGSMPAGRWRTFEIHMAPYLPRLRPFIKGFSYADGGA
ncbi:tetratricopeptide repeat protein [bacterium SCSIO 12827]|nr:tetratricopeptide repeat protein [bacterium SCSIO 12827]